MNIVKLVEPRIADVSVGEAGITAYLVDGCTVTVPLAWPWRMSETTSVQRNCWELMGDGIIVHWPNVDGDISVAGMLNRMPVPRPTALL